MFVESCPARLMRDPIFVAIRRVEGGPQKAQFRPAYAGER
jgi:hypothetical protein